MATDEGVFHTGLRVRPPADVVQGGDILPRPQLLPGKLADEVDRVAGEPIGLTACGGTRVSAETGEAPG